MIVTRTRLLAAGLLVAATIAFTAGTAVERHASGEGHEARPAASPTATSAGTPTTPTTTDTDGGEPGGEGQGDSGQPTGHPESTTEPNGESHSEALFGVNPESTGLVVVAIVLSVLLAAGLLFFRSRRFAAGVGLVMLAFTALDVREIVHQLDESRSGLAVLATLVALLHLLAAAAAIALARPSRPGSDLPRAA